MDEQPMSDDQTTTDDQPMAMPAEEGTDAPAEEGMEGSEAAEGGDASGDMSGDMSSDEAEATEDAM